MEMNRAGYVSVVLFCFVVWVLVWASFVFGFAEATTENMIRVGVGSAVTAFMVACARNLYLNGKLF